MREHSITWRRFQDLLSSIDVVADKPTFCRANDGVEVVLASFKCPYCWDESTFIEPIRDGEILVVVCERASAEFAVRF